MENRIASDQSYLVVGAGVTGESVVRHLISRGCQLELADTRTGEEFKNNLKKKYPEIKIHFGELTAELLTRFNFVVMSPGIDLRQDAINAAKEQGVKITCDIEMFVHQVDRPVIGITGSNGKSTVTSLVGEMLNACGMKAKIGGNIGVPVLSLLGEQADCYVLELSSFQLDLCQDLPLHAATVLNLSPDHLDRYDSYEDYIDSKLTIFKKAKHWVLNKDEILSQPMVPDNKKVAWFGQNPDLNHYGLLKSDGDWFLAKGTNKLMNSNEVSLKGRHNLLNILAACALVETLGVNAEEALQVAKSYQSLPHRCEWVATANSVGFINDSKGTNVGATLAAINGLGSVATGKIILILGGEAKDQNFQPLKKAMDAYVKASFSFGRDKNLICQQLNHEPEQVSNLEDAVDKSKAIAEAGDIVLFSPACASFDMYKNFEARGDHFKSLVNGSLSK